MKGFMSFLAQLFATMVVMGLAYEAAYNIYDSGWPFIFAFFPLYPVWFAVENRSAWQSWKRTCATICIGAGVFALMQRFDPALFLVSGAVIVAVVWNRR